MLEIRYESHEDFEDTKVYYRPKQDALKRRDIRMINDDLREICQNEANKLYRLAWKMQEHGCKPENVQKCRSEAEWLNNTGFPWDVLNPFTVWEYAFQY